jgi:hypothetical protein
MLSAETIAKGLTEGQRVAVSQARWSETFGKWHLPLATNLRVVSALAEKGLLLRPPGWKLNSLGVRVREVLLAKEAK